MTDAQGNGCSEPGRKRHPCQEEGRWLDGPRSGHCQQWSSGPQSGFLRKPLESLNALTSCGRPAPHPLSAPSFCLWPVPLHLSELPREPPSSLLTRPRGRGCFPQCPLQWLRRCSPGRSLCGLCARRLLHLLTWLPLVPALKQVGQSWLILGTPTPHPCPRLQSLLPAVNSGTQKSSGCFLMSFVSGQRIILQMLHLGEKGRERERIPNKTQDDLRKSGLFQGKWLNSFFNLPEHGLLARQPSAMVPEGVC